MIRRVRIKAAMTFLAAALAAVPAIAQDVQIGVFGLFHPRHLTVRAAGGAALVVHAGERAFVLERSSGTDAAELRLSGGAIAVEIGTQTLRASELRVTSRNNSSADFVIAVPGKITRHYSGTLEIKAVPGELVPVVRMDLETAVASVVAVEGASGAPLEALKAQAIAARSYFVAGAGRHHSFDFCDTTHCQLLREPPAPDAPAAKAAAATRGLVLAYQRQPFAAMYTRSCGGRTRTPVELGMRAGAYPYYPVECRYCREHPSRWQTQVSARDADALRNSGESARLQIDRLFGWNFIRSNNFTARSEGGHVLLDGTGQGHGIGLCQAGAAAMAEDGATFRDILAYYYPNTALVHFQPSAGSGL